MQKTASLFDQLVLAGERCKPRLTISVYDVRSVAHQSAARAMLRRVDLWRTRSAPIIAPELTERVRLINISSVVSEERTQMNPARQMHLGVYAVGTGNHVSGWRFPGAATSSEDFAIFKKIADSCERGKRSEED